MDLEKEESKFREISCCECVAENINSAASMDTKRNEADDNDIVIDFSDDDEEMSLLKDDEELPINLKATVRRIALAEIAMSCVVSLLCFYTMFLIPLTDEEDPIGRLSNGNEFQDLDSMWYPNLLQVSPLQMILVAAIFSQLTQLVFALCLLMGANYKSRDSCEPWVALQCLLLLVNCFFIFAIQAFAVDTQFSFFIIFAGLQSCLYKAWSIWTVLQYMDQLTREMKVVPCYEKGEDDDEDDEDDFIYCLI